jgi:hypothetical protein
MALGVLLAFAASAGAIVLLGRFILKADSPLFGLTLRFLGGAFGGLVAWVLLPNTLELWWFIAGGGSSLALLYLADRDFYLLKEPPKNNR